MRAPLRAGRATAARCRHRLSHRELAVLNSVNRFRYLSARQIEELSFADAPSRLASYLLDLADRKSTSYQGRTYLELDMRKGELASRLGTVSETLSRTFKKLKDEEVIEVDGNKVTVLNMERLRAVAGR